MAGAEAHWEADLDEVERREWKVEVVAVVEAQWRCLCLFASQR